MLFPLQIFTSIYLWTSLRVMIAVNIFYACWGQKFVQWTYYTNSDEINDAFHLKWNEQKLKEIMTSHVNLNKMEILIRCNKNTFSRVINLARISFTDFTHVISIQTHKCSKNEDIISWIERNITRVYSFLLIFLLPKTTRKERRLYCFWCWVIIFSHLSIQIISYRNSKV